MFLSDRDILWAIQRGKLIVQPTPKKIDPSSFDVHLGAIEEAKIWDLTAFESKQKEDGNEPYVRIANYNYKKFAAKYTRPPGKEEDEGQGVFRRGDSIIVRPNGFLLWQTEEIVGTPDDDGHYICFVNGKSTRSARTGLLIHATALKDRVRNTGATTYRRDQRKGVMPSLGHRHDSARTCCR